ncbi:MAG: hypothetical protein ACK5NK_06785 [Niabella sp.]
MKKLFLLFLAIGVVGLTSCNVFNSKSEADQKAADEKADSLAKLKDSTLYSIPDSLKANVNEATEKLKSGISDIKDGAEALGKAAAGKAKEGATAVKEGTQKVGNAVKEGVKATKEALQKND